MPLMEMLSMNQHKAGNTKDALQKLGLLLFWPIYLILFVYLERFHETDGYYPMYCPVDDLIPFCEWFLIPYLFWFFFLAGSVFFTLFTDGAAFRRMMHFIILTHSAALLIFYLFPTCQELRPVEFPRDNALTRFMAAFYQFDTNTNVCPSLHVIGSVGAMLGFQDCKWFSAKRSRTITLIAVTALISVSTVFLKQHSVLDVVAAIPICLGAYLLVYRARLPERSAHHHKHIKKTVT